MLERKTIVDQVEINRIGIVGVRLALLIVDGDVEVAKQYHRTCLNADSDIAEVFRDMNGHLQSEGFEPVSQADITSVMGYAQHAFATD